MFELCNVTGQKFDLFYSKQKCVCPVKRESLFFCVKCQNKPTTYHYLRFYFDFYLHNGDSRVMRWSIPIDKLIFCYYEAMSIDFEITNKSSTICLRFRNVKSWF